MSILDQLIGYVAPLDCLGCGYEGGIVCDDCLDALKTQRKTCYRCRSVLIFESICDVCSESTGLSYARTVAIYKGLAKELVLSLKFQSARSSAKPMAQAMVALIEDPKSFVLVPLPTATTRARGRGYDQAKLLAKALSRQTRATYLDCLRRVGQSHQVGASRVERQRQLKKAFRLSAPHLIVDKQIILVDDVITTGSTIEAATALVKEAGASSVSAVAFAQA